MKTVLKSRKNRFTEPKRMTDAMFRRNLALVKTLRASLKSQPMHEDSVPLLRKMRGYDD